MARPSPLELCPECRVVFVSPQQLGTGERAAFQPGKRCPRGHWTHVAKLRANRPPADAVVGEIVPAAISAPHTPVAPPPLPSTAPVAQVKRASYADLRASLAAMLGAYNHVRQTLPSPLGRAMVEGAFAGPAMIADQMLGDE